MTISFKNKSPLFYIAIASVIICVAIQIGIQVIHGDAPQISDCDVHLSLAMSAFDQGQFYPTAGNIYDQYLLAPAFINFLVLQLHIFGTMAFNWVFNLLFSLLITYEIFWLAKRFFDPATGFLSVIAYSMLYSTWTCVYPSATEVPFLALGLSSLCLALKGGIWRLLIAGSLLALANSVRPLAILFLLAIITAMIYRRAKVGEYISTLIGISAIVCLIGCYVQSRTGYFKHTSTTGGLNMLIKANDKATGALPPQYNDQYTDMRLDLEKGMDYVHTDQARQKRAIDWILNNQGRWAILYLKGIPIMYFHDASFDGYFEENVGYIKTIENNQSFKDKIFERIPKSLVYYIVMLLFLTSLWLRRRQIFSPPGILLIVPVLGTLATCCFQTMARYHYPFMPFFIIWGCSALPLLFPKTLR